MRLKFRPSIKESKTVCETTLKIQIFLYFSRSRLDIALDGPRWSEEQDFAWSKTEKRLAKADPTRRVLGRDRKTRNKVLSRKSRSGIWAGDVGPRRWQRRTLENTATKRAQRRRERVVQERGTRNLAMANFPQGLQGWKRDTTKEFAVLARQNRPRVKTGNTSLIAERCSDVERLLSVSTNGHLLTGEKSPPFWLRSNNKTHSLSRTKRRQRSMRWPLVRRDDASWSGRLSWIQHTPRIRGTFERFLWQFSFYRRRKHRFTRNHVHTLSSLVVFSGSFVDVHPRISSLSFLFRTTLFTPVLSCLVSVR